VRSRLNSSVPAAVTLAVMALAISGCASSAGTAAQTTTSAQPTDTTPAPMTVKVTVTVKASGDSGTVSTPGPTHAGPTGAATRQPPPVRPPAWDGMGYTRADYASRVGDLPVWIGYVRRDSAADLPMTVGVDLAGLGHRFEEIGVPPAPPGVTASYWHASTTTLAQFSQMAADEWDNGDTLDAMARFEVIVKNSNGLVAKVDAAFHLGIPLSAVSAQASPPPAANPPRTSTSWPGTSLSIRLDGQPRSDVAAVQRRLDLLGYGPIPAHGEYGPITQAAVRSYQADHGLYVDGVVGPVTWKSLFG
jgi:hypothetical protein